MSLTCPQCRHSVPAPEAPGQEQVKCGNCGARFPVAAGQRRLTPRPPSPDAGQRGSMTGPFIPISPVRAVPDVSGWAIGSFVCSLLFFIPVITQALAVILGVVSLVYDGKRNRRVGLAWAGLIIGLLAGSGWAVIFLVMLAIPAGTVVVTPYGYGPAATTQPAGAAGTAAGPPVAISGYGGRVMAGYGPSDQAAYNQMQFLREGLDRLSAAIEGFRRDSRRWPRRLDELVPVYIPKPMAERFRSRPEGAGEPLVTLLTEVDPIDDPPDRIVAYSLPVMVNDFGEPLEKPGRWVLRLGGAVELVESEQVDRSVGKSTGTGEESNKVDPPTSSSGD